MTVAIAPPSAQAPAPALSPAHGASLATTAGITAVITGVLAGGLAAQVPAAPGGLAGALAGGAIAALALGAGALYEARNAIGAALDQGPGGADGVVRGLRAYHVGMAGVFLGLALAAAWRVALPLGGVGWLAPAAAGLAALRAGWMAWGVGR